MNNGNSHRAPAKGIAARTSRRLGIALFGAWLAGCGGCHGLRVDKSGIVLPPGDADRGKVAFRELKCHECHSVSGHEFPHPTVRPPVLVVLGTEDRAPGRATLINSIINPSHRIDPGIDRELVQTNGASRMTFFSEILTVQQLSDLVSFLETLHR